RDCPRRGSCRISRAEAGSAAALIVPRPEDRRKGRRCAGARSAKRRSATTATSHAREVPRICALALRAPRPGAARPSGATPAGHYTCPEARPVGGADDVTKPANPVRLTLASASPARRELLARTGIPFDVMPADVEEPTGFSDPRTFVQSAAWVKAAAVAPRVT